MAFSVLQWNCRSINTTKDQFIQHLVNNKYQAIALQSLAVVPSKLPVIDGYHYPPFYTLDDQGKVRVATYVVSGLSVSNSTPPDIPLEGFYQVLTDINLQNGSKIHLLNIYSPTPRNVGSFDWLKAFDNDWLIVGDFNRRDSLWDDSWQSSSPEIASSLSEADVILLNDGSPTRIPDSPNCNMTAVDLAFISSNLAAITSWLPLEDPLNSDHLPIKIEIEVAPSRQPPEVKKTFLYQKADWDKFQIILMNSNFKSDPSKSVDQENAEITHEILHAAEQSIPIQGGKCDGVRGHPW